VRHIDARGSSEKALIPSDETNKVRDWLFSGRASLAFAMWK
jgi:hypothetical protein